jgi:ketosteroid isomerase-like protein
VNGDADGTAVTWWDAVSHDDEDATHVLGGDENVAEPDDAERKVVRPRRWPYQIAAGVMVFAALVALGLIAGLLFDDPSGSAARTGPLSEDEVRDTAQAFADAYADEDPAALRATLARDVVRVLPGGRSEGRDQVVDQYQRQFDGKVKGYKLDNLSVTGGRAGRASGDYRVDRDGGDPYEGRIVFGIVRQGGEARIELIAATPKA